MKRYSLLLIALTVLLITMSAACMAEPVGPSYGLGCFPDRPHGYLDFVMQQGWFCDQLVWFIATDTNNAKFAEDNELMGESPLPVGVSTQVKAGVMFKYLDELTFAPKLGSALGSPATGELYIVVNSSCTQAPVFSTAPGQGDYTPIWHVNYITWLDIRDSRPITNTLAASDMNPRGIPGPDQVQITSTDIIVDAPILAVGPLGGPWYPALPGSYRIPQAYVYPDYARTKIVSLPFWVATCQDQVTKKVNYVAMLLTDAAYMNLANLTGANFAPALIDFPMDDTQRMWWFPDSVISCQPPVEEWCPTSNSHYNTQYLYSPVEDVITLDRSALPPCASLTSRTTILFYLNRGLLSATGCTVANTPLKVFEVCTNDNKPKRR